MLQGRGGGKTVEEVCREANISEQTFYRWRRKYGRMEMADAKRYKELEAENGELKSGDVLNALAEVIPQRGVPKCLRSDNGSEFIAREVQDWLQELGMGTIHIDPGSPWQNVHIESFHNRLRDEGLNQEVFLSVTEARVVIEEWRNFYNHIHPTADWASKAPMNLPTKSANLETIPGS